MKNNIKNKINKLVNDLNAWNKEYFDNNNSSVSDRVYDTHLNELIRLEKKYPQYILKNSPTQKIGAKVSNKFKKIKHNKPMLSLDKAYSFEDIHKFINDMYKLSNNEKIDFFIEPKVDGLSISLHYEHGKLIKAITRGDGIEGEDVTNNVLNVISDIPIHIKYKNYIEVRGEIFISKNNFVKINELENFKYANPRNLASGTLRQLNNKIIKERNLSAFIYDSVDYKRHNLETQDQLINFLEKNNFRVFKDKKVVNNLDEITDFINYFNNKKNNLDYEVDGIVIKLNQTKHYETIGYTAKFPKYTIAYKFDDEIVNTTLEDIFISIGRTSIVTYNAKLKSVLLKGTIVSSATLHNYNYIEELNLNIGDEVSIKKAGEIIPKVISVIKKNNPGIFQKILICPFCNTKLLDTKTFNNQICPNNLCSEINIRKIIHFSSREGMNIEGLGEMIVRKFYELNYLRKIEDIYTLDKFKEQIIAQKGFGNKFWNNLWTNILASKSVSLNKLIFSLGILQLGSKTAKLIAKQIKSFDNFLSLDINLLNEIKDIGPITINEIEKYIKNENNINLVNFLIKEGINPKLQTENIAKENFFSNNWFVITGKLKKSRNEITKLIEKSGGNVTNSISKKINYLILGRDNRGNSDKFKKAQKLKIPIISEEEFNQLISDLEIK